MMYQRELEHSNQATQLKYVVRHSLGVAVSRYPSLEFGAWVEVNQLPDADRDTIVQNNRCTVTLPKRVQRLLDARAWRAAQC